MENTTKERILDAALVSFADNGYKGTNLRDLAAGLGLSKSALYKHFEGKEDIWNALLDRVEAYYNERFGSPENLPDVPKTCEELLTLSMKMIDFTVHDERIVLTRKLLLTEQFRDERAAHFATLHFLTSTKEIYTYIFTEMMKNGLLKKDDAQMLAFAYTSPISALIQLCDREPQRKDEIIHEIEQFARHFISEYAIEKTERNNMIAFCGLNCEKCDARIATVNDDDELRQKTARLWTVLNGVEITKDMINCMGCCADGVKTPYCENLCPIRHCALEKGFASCGNCSELEKCEKVGMIIGSDNEAKRNLKGEYK